jgi:regulatory protein
MGRKITALTAQKRNPERVNVYLEGEFAFGLARLVAAWLQVGQELSEEKIAALQAEDALEAAYQQALKYLNYRVRTKKEVQDNLKRHGISDEIITQILGRLQTSGLVDDQRFAQAWVDNRSVFHPRSRRALAYEMQHKGLDEETVQQALDEVDDAELAYQAASKQARRLEGLEWPDFRQKMYAFLARRGFAYGTAAEAAARVWSDLNPE